MAAYECMMLIFMSLVAIAFAAMIMLWFWSSWKVAMFVSVVMLAGALMGTLAFASRPDLGGWQLPILQVLTAWLWGKWSESLYRREKKKDVDDS